MGQQAESNHYGDSPSHQCKNKDKLGVDKKEVTDLEETGIVGIPCNDWYSQGITDLQQVLAGGCVFPQVIRITHVQHRVDVLLQNGITHVIQDLRWTIIIHENHFRLEVVDFCDGIVIVS